MSLCKPPIFSCSPMTDKETPRKRRRGRNGDNRNSSTPRSNGKKQHSLLADHSRLLIDSSAGTLWFDYEQADRNATRNNSKLPAMDPVLLATTRSRADAILSRDVQLYREANAKDWPWMQRTVQQGTLKDRVAATAVLIANSPVHSYDSLQTLLQYTGSTSTSSNAAPNARVAQLAALALQDVFCHTLLPTTRKLISLDQRPLEDYESSKKTLSPRLLLLWRFEELVQQSYHAFLHGYLRRTLQLPPSPDTEPVKRTALKLIATLLAAIPEAEQLTLNLLVNKLGDPTKKLAATAAHHLRVTVLDPHPAMVATVARSVQQLVHRPHLGGKAIYNGICFLNQLQLSAALQELALSLLETYVRLLAVALPRNVKKSMKKGKKDKNKKQFTGNSNDNDDNEPNTRLLSALLTGIHRAMPFAMSSNNRDSQQQQATRKLLASHLDALYRVVHTAPPAARTQALHVLYPLQVAGNNEDDDNESLQQSRNRFYRALYETIDPLLITSSGSQKHWTLAFNLVYKAVKQLDNARSSTAFLKRLVACASLHGNASVAAASWVLVREFLQENEELRSIFQECDEGKVIYDPLQRDPRFAIRSEEETEQHQLPSGWELCLTLHHYHPSVRALALEAVHGNTNADEQYNGDPLTDFNIGTFLDKFAYRNPKQVKKVKKSATTIIAPSRVAALQEQLPMNDARVWDSHDAIHRPHETFFRTYFSHRSEQQQQKKSSKPVPAQSEEGALDATEDHFATWEDDPEEEAFVDSLAESLMEDEAGGPVDVDDDEDMEEDEDEDSSGDWDDVDENSVDVDDFDDPEVEDDDDNDGDDNTLATAPDEDEDAFMERDEDSDDEEGLEESPFEVDDEGDDSDSGSDFPLAEFEDEEEEEDELPEPKKGKKMDAIFAPAEDYEEIIAASFKKHRRQQ